MKVIKITAVWCPACIVMNSRWDKIMADCGWLEVINIDFDRDKERALAYNVGQDIPVFVFLDKEGKEFARLQGEIDRKELIKFIEENKDR
jgi:thiol-disulfide isomerase/thioredoxin